MWQKKIKKTLFTLAINDWEPEICQLTFPLLKYYADKISADFYIIKERKFPEWPITYEKLQVYQLSQEMQNDWNIYIDADALVHPEMYDVTQFINKDTVVQNAADKASLRWKSDSYFLRDGRDISSCNWLTIASDWCIDVWHPIEDLTPEQCINSCFPTVDEQKSKVVTPYHLIDDFILSRNIAKYGLKYKKIIDLNKEIGYEDSWFFWHQYTMPPEQKVVEMIKILEQWKLR